MYLLIYLVGTIACLCYLVWLIYKYFAERKYIYKGKGRIVESRVLSREDMIGSDNGANILIKIEYSHGEKSFFHSYKEMRLKLPQNGEEMDIYFNTKSYSISLSHSIFEIIEILPFLFFFVYFLSVSHE